MQILKKRIIIFGAGYYGRNMYHKLTKEHDVVYFADNNLDIVGTTINGVSVIAGCDISELDVSDIDIVICIREYDSICNQLIEMNIVSYYIALDGFLYHTDLNETLMPCELEINDYFNKDSDEKNILFVQRAACIRTHKIAVTMKEQGYKVYLLYTLTPPIDDNCAFCNVYDQMWGFSSMQGIIDFVEGSEFDIIHCSNEPDILANLLNLTSKKVVFDTHDMQSLRGNISMPSMVLEYCANKYSDGNMYTSQGVVDIASEKFGIDPSRSYALENVLLDETNSVQLPKLSSVDDEIHCVYEGAIEGKNRSHHRFFEEIWLKIAAAKVHIHFYCPEISSEYCKKLSEKSDYLHYEGAMGSQELIQEMTKYDCGLAIFNVNDVNRIFLETGTANKVYEYINARLPVAVGNIKSYKNFVEKYNVGMEINLEGNILSQFQKLVNCSIPSSFLKRNRMTMLSRGEDLENYYESIKCSRQDCPSY